MKVNHAVASRKRKKKVLDEAKGYWGRRSKHHRRAIETVRRALAYAYRDRKVKKREFRSLWIERINAAVRERGLTYREFMHFIKEKGIVISRDILAQIAAQYPEVFDKVVEEIKK